MRRRVVSSGIQVLVQMSWHLVYDWGCGVSLMGFQSYWEVIEGGLLVFLVIVVAHGP
jgi:hypothetical protein